MKKPLVGILMGSESDKAVMEEAARVLEGFGIPFEMTVSSAHRTPKRTLTYAEGAERRGIKVIIAGAGHAAHLAGFVAAKTALPVIGVPIDSSSLKGLDALLSTVQMPGGVPVAAMAVGKSGARNAGILAAQILSVSNKRLMAKVKKFRSAQSRKVAAKAGKIKFTL
jgi:phosphoribosylaminoimidazole carboxylase PurE protein